MKPTHVKAASNAGTLQWLLAGVLFSGCHETRHLTLGELDLTTTKGRQRHVGDLGLACWSAHLCGVVV